MDLANDAGLHPAASKSSCNITRLLGTVIETGDDFLDSKQLRAYFPRPLLVEHHSTYSNPVRGIWNRRRVERWTRQKELGRGAFGTVYLEEDSRGALRAVKEIPRRAVDTKTIHYLREILALAKFSQEDSAYFIRLIGWFQSDEYVHIAMEYAPFGDLSACVQNSLPLIEAQTISQQIAQALSTMHEKHFVHRDLSPANIFVFQTGQNWWVKLGDFGMSKRAHGRGTGLHTSVDTAFAAPEMLHIVAGESEKDVVYTDAVDMWSFGFLIHWLLTYQLPLRRGQLYPFCLGKKPFPTEAMMEKSVPIQIQELVAGLIRPDPKERMTVRQVLSHPWLHRTEEEDVEYVSESDDMHHSLSKTTADRITLTPTSPDHAATPAMEGAETKSAADLAEHNRALFAAVNIPQQNASKSAEYPSSEDHIIVNADFSKTKLLQEGQEYGYAPNPVEDLVVNPQSAQPIKEKKEKKSLEPPATPMFGNDGRLISAAAATSLKYVRPQDLPSFPAASLRHGRAQDLPSSAAIPHKYARAQDLPSYPPQSRGSLSPAVASASLLSSSKKTFEHWKPDPIPAAAQAAMQAKDYKLEPLWQPVISMSGPQVAQLARRNSKDSANVSTPLSYTDQKNQLPHVTRVDSGETYNWRENTLKQNARSVINSDGVSDTDSEPAERELRRQSVWDELSATAARLERERMEHEREKRPNHVYNGMVHIGGGKYMDQSEIDAIARARVKPMLDAMDKEPSKAVAANSEAAATAESENFWQALHTNTIGRWKQKRNSSGVASEVPSQASPFTATMNLDPAGFNLPIPKDDREIEQMFIELMYKRGWQNLPEEAKRQMLAYAPAKKWTLVHQDKLTEWQAEQKRRQQRRQVDSPRGRSS